MIKNVFDNKYAECLILRDQADGSGEKGEAVGLALVSPQPKDNSEKTILICSTFSITLHGLEPLVYT
jgi:hypothetical protein